MSSKIQLTPAELLSQSAEMKSLQAEYDGLFGSVGGLLADINRSWSPNLSNNFSGKIASAKNSFSDLLGLLSQGADIAADSARTYESVDNLLARVINGGDAAAAVKTAAPAAASSDDDGFFDNIKKACSGAAHAVVRKVENVVSDAIDSYKSKGEVYKIAQYGKTGLKLAGATVKIVGAAVSIASGVGVPIGIASAISGINDLANAHADLVYIDREMYEQVGSENLLKDTLEKNGSELGKMLGNEEAGKMFGDAAYYGLDVVSLLNGVDGMLKSFGKLNTVVTGTTGDSPIWGHTTFDDVLDPKLRGIGDFIKSRFFDPGSDAWVVSEAIQKTSAVIKKAKKVSGIIGSLIAGAG